MRAFSVVNCQLIVALPLLRWGQPAGHLGGQFVAVVDALFQALAGQYQFSSISAMLSQLPCLGV